MIIITEGAAFLVPRWIIHLVSIKIIDDKLDRTAVLSPYLAWCGTSTKQIKAFPNNQ